MDLGALGLSPGARADHVWKEGHRQALCSQLSLPLAAVCPEARGSLFLVAEPCSPPLWKATKHFGDSFWKSREQPSLSRAAEELMLHSLWCQRLV